MRNLVALLTVTSLAAWNCWPSMTRSWQLTFKDVAAQDVAQHPIFLHKLAMNLSDWWLVTWRTPLLKSWKLENTSHSALTLLQTSHMSINWPLPFAVFQLMVFQLRDFYSLFLLFLTLVKVCIKLSRQHFKNLEYLWLIALDRLTTTSPRCPAFTMEYKLMCSVTTLEHFPFHVWLILQIFLEMLQQNPSCVQAVTFFQVVQKLYVFLASSTSQWNVLMEKLKTTDWSVPKRLSETRWSHQKDLMHSTVWTRTIASTLKFCNWLLKTRCRRKLLNRKLILSSKLWRSWKRVFWRLFGAVFWREQTWLVSFSNLRQLVWDLQWVFFSHWVTSWTLLRERNKFEEFVEMGKKLSGSLQFFCETNKVLQTNFRWPKCSRCYTLSRISTFLVIIDSFLPDLRKRIKAYSKVDELFSFLRHTDVEADVFLNGVVDFYSKDLKDLNAVENEWFQWRSLLKNFDVTFCSPSEMLKLMVQNDFSTSIVPKHLHSSSSVLDSSCDELYHVSAPSVTSNASNLL